MQWRARCLALSGRPRAAWELFTSAQASGKAAAAGEDGYTLLLGIANDCYRMGAFYYAAKASCAACAWVKAGMTIVMALPPLVVCHTTCMMQAYWFGNCRAWKEGV